MLELGENGRRRRREVGNGGIEGERREWRREGGGLGGGKSLANQRREGMDKRWRGAENDVYAPGHKWRGSPT